MIHRVSWPFSQNISLILALLPKHFTHPGPSPQTLYSSWPFSQNIVLILALLPKHCTHPFPSPKTFYSSWPFSQNILLRYHGIVTVAGEALQRTYCDLGGRLGRKPREQKEEGKKGRGERRGRGEEGAGSELVIMSW